jgi:hypothetical protein
MKMSDKLGKLDEIKDTSVNTRIAVVKIEEHLKALNGKVITQQGNINDLYDKHDKTQDKLTKNSINTSKIYGTVTFIVSAVGSIIALAFKSLFGGK